jgi:hypothetical protein
MGWLSQQDRSALFSIVVKSMGLAFSEAYDILPQQLRFERLWVETGGKL